MSSAIKLNGLDGQDLQFFNQRTLNLSRGKGMYAIKPTDMDNAMMLAVSE